MKQWFINFSGIMKTNHAKISKYLFLSIVSALTFYICYSIFFTKKVEDYPANLASPDRDKTVRLRKELVRNVGTTDEKAAQQQARKILLAYMPIGSDAGRATRFLIDTGFRASNGPNKFDNKAGIERRLIFATLPDNGDFVKWFIYLAVTLHFNNQDGKEIITGIDTEYYTLNL